MEAIMWTFFEKWIKHLALDIFHFRFLEDKWDACMQFIKFGLVGVSNTVISYVIYLMAVSIGCHYLVASVLGFIVSVINAFFWNNKYVFQIGTGETRSVWRSFWKTFVAYAGTGLVLNNALLIVQVDVFKWSKTIAPLINLIITIPLNFIINKLWAFRTNKQKEQ